MKNALYGSGWGMDSPRNMEIYVGDVLAQNGYGEPGKEFSENAFTAIVNEVAEKYGRMAEESDILLAAKKHTKGFFIGQGIEIDKYSEHPVSDPDGEYTINLYIRKDCAKRYAQVTGERSPELLLEAFSKAAGFDSGWIKFKNNEEPIINGGSEAIVGLEFFGNEYKGHGVAEKGVPADVNAMTDAMDKILKVWIY